MPESLNPAPSDLGIFSPALGQWFDDNNITNITLAPPNEDLSVTLNGSFSWQAPATGLLSLFIATNPRPSILASLRNASGGPAFEEGHLIALFRLLPEVEERLYSLQAYLPSVTGDSNSEDTQPTRAKIRYFALEPMVNNPNIIINILVSVVSFPQDLNTDEKKAKYVGLKLENGVLTNGESPVTILKRASEKLIQINNIQTKFWAFDANGRPIDPGAVASWWKYLATEKFDNLWASNNISTTANVNPQRTFHIVNAHEGPLEDVFPVNRLSITGATEINSDSKVYKKDGQNVQISFNSPPEPNDAPVPRVAVLPYGVYSDQVTLWANEIQELERDFVKIAIVDVEYHLVGQKRISNQNNGLETIRAQNQNRESTRVRVARAQNLELLRTTEEISEKALSVLDGEGKTCFVTSVLSRDWGYIQPLELPDLPPPDSLPEITVSALQGGGREENGVIRDQKILVEMSFDSNFSGAWMRVWPLDLDLEKGYRFRRDGGAGRVRDDGSVSIIVPLPDGKPNSDIMLDIAIVTGHGMRFFPNQIKERPAPVEGEPLTLNEASGEIVICETGEIYSDGNLPQGSVPSGASLFVRTQNGPALIDLSSLPNDVWNENTIIRKLSNEDVIQLTEPAFENIPRGNFPPDLETTGAEVKERSRNDSLRMVAAGAPWKGMERLEMACAKVTNSSAKAVVGSTPCLGSYHELLPHQLGHPGAPASVEMHGTGVYVEGPAAVEIAEILRDYCAGSTPELLQEANTPFPQPQDPQPPSSWLAALRTVAAAVEAELGTDISLDDGIFDDLQGAIDWINNNISSNLNSSNFSSHVESVLRAFSRRMVIAKYGGMEGAFSLVAAFRRAEDFIYIETPALDKLDIGNQDNSFNLWQTLLDRIDERHSLKVILCLPVCFLPGYPLPLKKSRDHLLLEAIKALKEKGSDRVAIFSPGAGPGRSLKIASTTVIVDDVYAFIGTTHLWRRGLCFDSSLSVAVFDEKLKDGRSKKVRKFRHQLIADRLGLSPSLLPIDPSDLVSSLKELVTRDNPRIATAEIEEPADVPDSDQWDPDGSFDKVTNLESILGNLISGTEIEKDLPCP